MDRRCIRCLVVVAVLDFALCAIPFTECLRLVAQPDRDQQGLEPRAAASRVRARSMRPSQGSSQGW